VIAEVERTDVFTQLAREHRFQGRADRGEVGVARRKPRVENQPARARNPVEIR